jgi:hypothetical protein
MTNSRDEKFDGIHFISEGKKLKITLFNFVKNEPLAIDTNIFYIVIFKLNENSDHFIFDDHYELKLVDPEAYVENFVGSGLSGCLVKKSNRAADWLSEYIEFMLKINYKKWSSKIIIQ